MKRGNSITEGASERWFRQRFNAWRNVTPQILASALDQFDSGYLRQAALMWENRVKRDDSLAGAVPKRTASVARLKWEILQTEDTPRAEQHKQALEDFYNQVKSSDALDLDRFGGLRDVVKQMMRAVFQEKAAHELIWTPGRDDVRVECRHVPLYFFERTTGRLRYTGPEYSANGMELVPGGWMVTSSEGLMHSCLTAALFKNLSLSDWISFSEKFGMPGIHGEINAAPDSPEWASAAEALHSFANEWVCLSREGLKVNLIEAARTGEAPFEPMVERMSRTMMMLCRGADLGTMSSKDGAGASLQADESNLLLEDDAELIGETLQHFLSQPVIWHLFREEPLAYIDIQLPADVDTGSEIEVDDFLINKGVPIAKKDLAERYGRSLAEDEETIAETDQDETEDPELVPAENVEADDDDALLQATAALVAQATSEEVREPLYEELRGILLTENDADLRTAILGLRERLPDYLDNTEASEAAWGQFTAAAILKGWSETLNANFSERTENNRPVKAVQSRAIRSESRLPVSGARSRDRRSKSKTGANR